MLAHRKNTERLRCCPGPVAYAHRQRSVALRAKTKQPDLYGRSTTKQPDLYGRSTTNRSRPLGSYPAEQPKDSLKISGHSRPYRNECPVRRLTKVIIAGANNPGSTL